MTTIIEEGRDQRSAVLARHREVEAALRESEARFRTMADSAPVLLWMARTDGLCEFFNAEWLRFTGRPMDRELGNGWAEGVHPEDFQTCMTKYMDAFVARRRFAMEYRLRRADGEYRWVYDQGVPRFAPDGTFAGYIGSCIDVTDSRRAQEDLRRLAEGLEERVSERTSELRAALAEREVLLREIHHRVKNNLQLVMSLVHLEARKLEGPARAAVVACENRIGTIVLIHESLYQSTDLDHVALAPYLESLVDRIRSAVAVADTIDVSVHCDDVFLPIGAAMRCGLVVNELMTNAVKHAFPSGHGSIRIGVARLAAPPRLLLCVEDDGVGLPLGLEPSTTATLGLRLVDILAAQLKATLDISRDHGTSVRITFALPDSNGSRDDAARSKVKL